MISTLGTIRYYNTYCVLWLDKDIAPYYRSLVPRAWYIKPPMNPTHISVVRKFETPDKTHWGKYDGRPVYCQYVLPICHNVTYCWLDAYSSDIQAIRTELGLPIYVGDHECYHITIGNFKGD